MNSAGRAEARISSAAFEGRGFTAELEILRGEFVRVLHDVTREDTEYLFNDRVVSLTDTGDRGRVGFLHGPEREFDLVIAADGIRSKTPRLASPRTRAGIALQHAVLRLATAPGVRQLLGRLMTPPAEAFSLPDYGPAEAVLSDAHSTRPEAFEDARGW